MRATPWAASFTSMTRFLVDSDRDSTPMTRARPPWGTLRSNASGPGGTSRCTEWSIHSGTPAAGPHDARDDFPVHGDQPACLPYPCRLEGGDLLEAEDVGLISRREPAETVK